MKADSQTFAKSRGTLVRSLDNAIASLTLILLPAIKSNHSFHARRLAAANDSRRKPYGVAAGVVQPKAGMELIVFANFRRKIDQDYLSHQDRARLPRPAH